MPSEKGVHSQLAELYEDHCGFVQFLLKKGDGFITDNPYRHTPLHMAVFCKCASCVKTILQSMPKYINMQDDTGYTALHSAIEGDFQEGVDLILPCPTLNLALRGEDEFNVFHLAATQDKPDLMKSLLKVGPHLVNVQKSDGRSPLHIAAWHGLKNVVEILLTEGKANVDLTAIDNATALMYASYQGHVDTVETLLKHNADVNHQNESRCNTALTWAIQENRNEVAILLIQWPTIDLSIRDDRDFNALHLASMMGNVDVIKKIIKADPKLINFQKRDGFTPLHVAAFFGQNSSAEVLLSEGNAELNLGSIDNATPLMLAVYKNFSDIVKTILKFKPDVNYRDFNGVTALHVAVMFDLPRSFQFLTECPTLDIGVQDNEGRNALHLAAKFGHGAILKRLIELGPQFLDVLDKDGRSPLHLAVARKYAAGIEILVNGGASLEVTDVDGDTPLLYLPQLRLQTPDFSWSLSSETSPDIFKILKEAEAVMKTPTSSSNEEKNEPVVTKEDLAVAAFLVQHGADVTKKNNDGISFATLASEKWTQEVNTLVTHTSESGKKDSLMLESALKLLTLK